ncbi:BCD family MFS transporter [Sphingomonas sp. SUN039]|uniref:BCD family MFS transporter n=1 Tax=Sphingomonas sp. SUN039 TaxID=2937787 RepID=UPI002164B84E|nr:BCD family MFS transporter [Sphingomonas sp. SUN039]UVO54106.1 BCD family MFS transporter [Sphingomonas sp. SUN039]
MTPLSWPQIARLGLVQSAIGAMVMLSTSLLNRVMVVEYAMAAAIPAGLVAWHYAVQLSRPAWGYGSDKGRRRTPWIIGGMAVLAGGSMLAVTATVWQMLALAILAFTLIGAGVGAAGTSLLALLATRTAPERRAGAASLTWIMMIVGIIVAAGVAGKLLEPFSVQRLFAVVGGVALVAFALALLGVWGIEGVPVAEPRASPETGFGTALREIWADPEARNFTVFVFMSMLAYSMQDMILEPFAGLMFAYTPGQSTGLSGIQHQGVLAGMILVGFGARTFGGGTARGLRGWTVGGCLGSAVAVAALAAGAQLAPHWPLAANVALLGFCNGVFAVSAIGAMMALAGQGGGQKEGIRMGVWGAAQAIAFGLGGLIGAVGVDAMRAMTGADGLAFSNVFAVEAGLFLVAAWLAAGAVSSAPARAREVLA